MTDTTPTTRTTPSTANSILGRKKDTRISTRTLAAGSLEELAAAKARRVSLFGFDDQGNRIVWDLAAKP